MLNRKFQVCDNTFMKISPEIYKQIKDDIAAVMKALNGLELNRLDLTKDDEHLTVMWSLLGIVSHNRAFDDSHPSFANGDCKRILPYDGRDYCFYYTNGCNDKHVATALRAIREDLIEEMSQAKVT